MYQDADRIYSEGGILDRRMAETALLHHLGSIVVSAAG